MRECHFFLALTATQIRMHHTAGDRSGTNDADLDHQVVKICWLKSRQHCHLRATLDLKDADRVAPADHIERRLIFLRNRRHRIFDAAVLAQKPEAEVELRETAETQEVDFEQTEIFDVEDRKR